MRGGGEKREGGERGKRKTKKREKGYEMNDEKIQHVGENKKSNMTNDAG